MSSPVRSASAADVPVLASVLAGAFADDPLMTWAFPGPERPARLAAMFGFLAEHRYVPPGACTVLEGDEAVALWLPTGFEDDGEFFEEHGAAFIGALEGDVERLLVLGEAMGETHPHDPHWYLLAIGVAPGAQGRGLGSVLLAHTLAQADARGEPAYLEATSKRSRVLYERFGFEVVEERHAGDSPPFWPMWRAPRGSA
jgi:ribosomal protein S18 acetylase RimI-like enzyme